MNIQEHLLTCLAEEAGEITHAVCKALRFGLEDVVPNSLGQTNIDHLALEINDLLGVVELLKEHGVVLDVPRVDLILAKKKKVEFYLKYAEGAGTVL